MAKKQQKNNKQPEIATSRPPSGLVPWLIAAFAAAVLAVLVYSPALGGTFVFDDFSLPFLNSAYTDAPLRSWLGFIRPLTYFSYWLNFQVAGAEPAGYHWLNLLLHLISGGLVTAIIRKMLHGSGTHGFTRDFIAALCGLLFLVHPLQTEAVSYVSSRSEVLAVCLLWAALGHFVYRQKPESSWFDSASILALFLLAVASKEYSAAFPALLLLCDLYWRSEDGTPVSRIRANWRVYLPLGIGAFAGLAFVWRVIGNSDSAGFASGSSTKYLLTQGRVIWIYLGKFLFPIGQTIDYDLAPVTGFDTMGAIGLLALAAISVAAIAYRKQYPLASFGWLAFLLLLAPTSSFIPIADVIAERRVYLPSIGLLLIAAEFLRRINWNQAARAGAIAVVLIYAFVAYQRNQVWENSETLWRDTVSKAPAKYRPHYQLARVMYENGRFPEAAAEYAATSKLGPPDRTLLLNWGLALDDAGQPAEALTKLRESAAMHPNAHVYTQIARVYGKQGKAREALQALDVAEKLDPRFEMTYVYRGNVYMSESNQAQAAAEFNKALAINPRSAPALEGLRIAAHRN